MQLTGCMNVVSVGSSSALANNLCNIFRLTPVNAHSNACRCQLFILLRLHGICHSLCLSLAGLCEMLWMDFCDVWVWSSPSDREQLIMSLVWSCKTESSVTIYLWFLLLWADPKLPKWSEQYWNECIWMLKLEYEDLQWHWDWGMSQNL